MELATTFEILSSSVGDSCKKFVYIMSFIQFGLKRKKWLATPLMNITRRLVKVNDEISNPFNTELLYLLPFITRAQELTGPKHGIQFVYFNKIKF